MKAFYSEYAQHCMRFYVRHPHPKFKNDTDKQNWNACESALHEFSEKDKKLLLSVYGLQNTIPDNVYRVSIDRNINQDILWKLVNKLERIIAKRRNLI